MSKLTIRAAIEALTYADDKELINELENRAKKQFQENTYICHLCSPSSNNESPLYAFYAKSKDDLITQISECWEFCEFIIWWFEANYTHKCREMDKDYDPGEYWAEQLIEQVAEGDEMAQKKIDIMVKLAVDDGAIMIKTIDEAIVARK